MRNGLVDNGTELRFTHARCRDIRLRFLCDRQSSAEGSSTGCRVRFESLQHPNNDELIVTQRLTEDGLEPSPLVRFDVFDGAVCSCHSTLYRTAL